MRKDGTCEQEKVKTAGKLLCGVADGKRENKGGA
jgi:hypothetical protein